MEYLNQVLGMPRELFATFLGVELVSEDMTNWKSRLAFFKPSLNHLLFGANVSLFERRFEVSLILCVFISFS